MSTDVVMSGSDLASSSTVSLSPLLDFSVVHPSFPIPDRAQLMYQPLQEKEKEQKNNDKDKEEKLLGSVLANLQRFIPLSFQFERHSASGNGNGNGNAAVVMQVIKAELTGVELGKKAYNQPETEARPVYCIYEHWLNPSIARATQAEDYNRSVAANAHRGPWQKHCLAFGQRWYEEGEMYAVFQARFKSLTGIEPDLKLLKTSPASVAASITDPSKFKPLWSPSPVTNAEELNEAKRVISVAEPYYHHPSRGKKKESSVDSSPDAAASSRPELPHFPLPFTDGGGDDAESARHPILLRELSLCAMSGSIREKPNWHNKILNPLIRFRWKCEAKSQAPELSSKALMYMMQELDHLAELKRNALASPARVSYDLSPIDGVWQSDEAVEADLIHSILQEIKVLENVPEDEIDYHPGSDNQVIDLVHPSLFCVRYGRTRQAVSEFSLADSIGASTGAESLQVVLSPNGKAGPDPPKKAKTQPRRYGYDSRSHNYTVSDAYCWMPAEFDVDNGGKVAITSYINNLHPKKHEKLYRLLEKTFERCVPMLERVLTFISVGDGLMEESFRMKGGYDYDPNPEGDSIEERLAMADTLKEEARALIAASNDPKFAATEESADKKDEPAIAYLKTLRRSPVQALQRENTEHVLSQVHPDCKIGQSALSWLTTVQDALAHMILQECFGPSAPKTAADFDVERNNRLKKRIEALEAEEKRQAAEKAKKKAAAAEAKESGEEEELKDGDAEDEPMEDEDGEDNGEDDGGDDEAMDEDEDDDDEAMEDAGGEPQAATNQDYSHLDRLEPFFHPSVDTIMGELVKHAYAEATKIVNKVRSGNSSGLVFRNSLAKRWYEDFKTNLSPEAATSLKPALTHLQQISICAILEYFTAEYLELAGNAARDFRTETIDVKHLKLAAEFDAELKPLTDGIFKAVHAGNAALLFEQAQALYAATSENKEKALAPTLGGDPLVAALSKEEMAAQRKKEKEARKQALKEEDAADKIARSESTAGASSAADSSTSLEDEKAIAAAAAEEEEEDEAEDEDDEADDDEGDMDDYYSGRGIQLGDVSFPFVRPTPFELLPASSRVDLKGRRLQVIVKLANIVLTPSNPNYDGGSWHVEGMENERIVASSIVYLQSENITESLLRFRQSCRFVHPEQDDSFGPSTAWGLQRDAPLNQVLGSVVTREGRAIAFPNVFQHQVQPFKLIDNSKPGFRKILVFFLVNPNKRIPSSSTIPPQNQQWVDEYFTEQVHPLLLETPLIPDLANIVKQYAVGRYESEEEKAKSHFTDMTGAKKDRTKLMDERKAFVEQNSEVVFEREYAFCEH